nr:DUF2634 domain-containing protein [uncultured Flavonifractor sp.]
MTLFPLINAPDEAGQASGVLPLYREIAWDFEADRPLWRNGSPIWVTGAQAVATWAWNALHTVRGHLVLFTRSYGCELQELTGRPYTSEVKEAEAVRYVRECLQENPYISDVQQVEAHFSGSTLSLHCVINTIYGEVSVDAGL